MLIRANELARRLTLSEDRLMPLAAIFSPAGPQLTPDERAFFRDCDPWGFILMGRSCIEPDQIRTLTQELTDLLGRFVPITIDMEGGRVARLKPPHWPIFPSAARLACLDTISQTLAFEAVWLSYRLIAHELTSLGIHSDCAPVLDIPIAGADPIIGDRAFGDNALAIERLGRACLSGLQAGGVAGIIKHIPGHGRAEADSHLALPIVRADRAQLAQDFAPFRGLRDASMAMTAHIIYEAIDPDHCATHSQIVIRDIIRGEIGFEGLLMSDDLTMEALGTSPQGQIGDDRKARLAAMAWRAQSAIEAGCDVVLHCAGLERDAPTLLAEMQAIARVVPVLTGTALNRATAAEQLCRSPADPRDIASDWDRLRGLLARVEVTA